MRQVRKSFQYPIENAKLFKEQLLSYSQNVRHFCMLDGNDQSVPVEVSAFDVAVAIEAKAVISCTVGRAFNELQSFHATHNDWMFGYLSYDLKNELEDVVSENHQALKMPDLFFFIPKYVVFIEKQSVKVLVGEEVEENEVLLLLDQIHSHQRDYISPKEKPKIQSRITKDEYLDKIHAIRRDIKRGEVYELNFCQEFYAENSEIHPEAIFSNLNQISQAPFSVFLKNEQQYVLSASPERFLKKKGETLLSQPIKGTRKRGKTPAEDRALKNELYRDPKERSENVMIVDLVRNDLSRVAAKGSVKVEELFGVYSYLQVHQMISSVCASLKEPYTWLDAIKYAFPMGSMTGAPKVRAMELIEKYESSRRGVYSGAIGYISPTGDFDFNVVIRSILYDAVQKYVSFTVGGAIIMKADPEKEYEECLVKAQAMFNVLQ